MRREAPSRRFNVGTEGTAGIEKKSRGRLLPDLGFLDVAEDATETSQVSKSNLYHAILQYGAVGADGEIRTHMSQSPETCDVSASANSATPATTFFDVGGHGIVTRA